MAATDTTVSLRPFPYPYRAGLALCSDIDGCDRRTFLAVHRFLNHPEKGLGLPVADSFFVMGGSERQMAFFPPGEGKPGPDAALILAGIRAGLIDSIHSWGDFNALALEPALLRRRAEAFLDSLGAEGLEVGIWINHGSYRNRQNLMARLEPGYEGDDPGSTLYTGDLLPRLGIAFYWWSEVVSWPLSARSPGPDPLLFWRLGGNVLKNAFKTLAGRGERRRTGAQLTSLCQPVTLRDGNPLLAFTRFNSHPKGVWTLPSRHTLRHALGSGVLGELLRREGYAILYTHLGLPADTGGDLFPEPDRRALEGLAQHYRSGDIWVGTTSQILTYWRLSESLVWDAMEKEDRWVIHVRAIQDPLRGSRIPGEQELSGLCFYTPRPEKTAIVLAGRELHCRIFPADHTGRPAIGLPAPPPPAVDLLEG